MRYILKILLIASLITGCIYTNNSKKNAALTSTSIADTGFSPNDTFQLYFPAGVFSDSSQYRGRDSFTTHWYSKHLLALKEPVLFSNTSQNEIYRFTWLRTFHNPIVIRIEKSDDLYFLSWKQSDGAGGYDPGKMIVNRQKRINKSEWEKFTYRLQEVNFWNLTTNEEIGGNDGSQWILEGKNNNQYHVVDRWTPGKTSLYYKCCDYLIVLAGLDQIGTIKY